MLHLIKYLRSYAGFLLCSVALLFVQARCELALPDYMAKIVNEGIISGNSDFILQTGGMMMLVTLLGTACSIAVGYFASVTAAGVSYDLRESVFQKVGGFSNAEFDKFSTASLITRTTNDITRIQNLLAMFIRMAFYAPILGVGGVINALDKSTQMSWVIAVAVIVLIGLIMVMVSVALPRVRKVQTLVDRVNLVSRENLDGVMVIRAFNTQKFELGRFDEANKTLTDNNLFVNRAMSTMMPLMMLIMNVTTVAIVWIGSKQVSAFNLGIGDMMAFMQYAMQIIMSFLMLSMMFIMIPNAAVSATRINEVLETKESILDPDEPLHYGEDFDGSVEFRDVSFRYPGAADDVLRHISFTAKPGETTAIIGATGSGKSALVSLVMRFYDVTGGGIFIDGKDIRAVNRADLRKKIGYVPQKSLLFSGTIEYNLRYADQNAPQEQLLKSAEIAQAADFINEKEEGFATGIAQGGTNVSGGQRQRLSIARALVKNAPIYIFDDSFSALDLKTDGKLRAALKRETGRSTILLVAQRVSTIMHADQILVLDNGQLAGVGTHKELLENCDVYYQIARSQLSEEELRR